MHLHINSRVNYQLAGLTGTCRFTRSFQPCSPRPVAGWGVKVAPQTPTQTPTRPEPRGLNPTRGEA